MANAKPRTSRATRATRAPARKGKSAPAAPAAAAWAQKDLIEEIKAKSAELHKVGQKGINKAAAYGDKHRKFVIAQVIARIPLASLGNLEKATDRALGEWIAQVLDAHGALHNYEISPADHAEKINSTAGHYEHKNNAAGSMPLLTVTRRQIIDRKSAPTE